MHLFYVSCLHFESVCSVLKFTVCCVVLFVETSCLSGNGTIEGKFECGYLVSVKLGSEVLRGVLYHPEKMVAPPSIPQHENAIVPFKSKGNRSGRRRRNKRRWDPNYPKPNRSGYNFFFAEKHYSLKALYPNREREFTKMIGQSWNSLSPEERMVIVFFFFVSFYVVVIWIITM